MKPIMCQLVFLTLLPLIVFATEDPGAAISNIGANPRLGTVVDMSLEFTGSDGEKRPLRDFTREGKPTLLIPVYYRCPGLCSLTINETIRLVNELTLTLGKDYTLIALSFNAAETPELAKSKAENVFGELSNREAAERGWKFLVGEQLEIDTLLTQLSFQYVRDGAEFQHVSSIYVLSPEGKISQLFSGIDPSPWSVKLAIVEASDGKVGNILHQALLSCFRFDPKEGRYTFAAFTTVRVGGMIGLMCILGMWFWLWRTRDERGPQAKKLSP